MPAPRTDSPHLRRPRPLRADGRSPARRVGALALAAALAGCASASLQRDLVRVDVGRGTRPDIERAVPEMLNRHGYRMQDRRDTGNLLYYETAWLNRAPLEDEADRCPEECRTRIVVEARERGSAIYAVSLRVENMALVVAESTQWVALPPSAMFRDHIDELTSAIALEIDAGVRLR